MRGILNNHSASLARKLHQLRKLEVDKAKIVNDQDYARSVRRQLLLDVGDVDIEVFVEPVENRSQPKGGHRIQHTRTLPLGPADVGRHEDLVLWLPRQAFEELAHRCTSGAIGKITTTE